MTLPRVFQRPNLRQLSFTSPKAKSVLLGLVVSSLMLSFASPALAHHPLGGGLPTSAFEGFLSGVGHPVIGLDHLAFVIAAGLVAATKPKGLLIPVAFVIASLFGTGLHLQLLSIPAAEVMVSASVLAFGVILAMGNRLSLLTVVALGVLAGIFHGYAYGEAIFGAETSPLVAYLAGFATVQMAIALLCFTIGRSLAAKSSALRASLPTSPLLKTPLSLRFAGFTLAGVGGAFLSSVFLG